MKSNYYGPFLLLGAYLLYSVAHGLVKVLSGSVPPTQLMFARFIVAPFLLYPLYLLGKKTYRMTSPWLMAARVICGCTAMFFFFVAVKIGDIGKATLLFQFCTIWTFIASMLFFGERPSLYSKMAIPFAFIGLIMVLQPDFRTGIEIGDIYALLASFFYTGVVLSLKKLRVDNDSTSIIITNYSLASVFMLPAAGQWIWLSTSQWVLVGLMATFGLTGQYLFTAGYKYTDASIASAMALIGVPIMFVFGALCFGEVVNTMAIVGVCMVLTSLFVVTKYQ